MANDLKIEGLEAVSVSDISIQRGDGFVAKLAEIRAFGASKFQIVKLKINPEAFKVDVFVILPKVKATGKYKLQMALGVINIKGQGKMTADLGKLTKI